MDCSFCKHQEILHQYEPKWCNKYDKAIKQIRHNKKECYEIDPEIKRRIDKRKNNDRQTKI